MLGHPAEAAAAPVIKGAADLPIKALILDDSEADRIRLRRLCKDAAADIDFAEAASIAEFATKIDQDRFDIFFIDYRLAHGDGLIALEMLKRHPTQRRSAAIMVAGEGQIQVAVDAMKNGCSDFLLKDMMGPEMLSRAISNALLTAEGSEEAGTAGPVHAGLVRFAEGSGAEMRSILSSMLRRTRGLRHKARTGLGIDAGDLSALDASCARLWEFLEEYQAFVSEFAKRPRRLN